MSLAKLLIVADHETVYVPHSVAHTCKSLKKLNFCCLTRESRSRAPSRGRLVCEQRTGRCTGCERRLESIERRLPLREAENQRSCQAATDKSSVWLVLA